MTANEWSLDASDGELLVNTGVTGRAAKMGHRLTLAMTEWQATVRWSGGKPVEAELSGRGGIASSAQGRGRCEDAVRTGEKLARSNALNSLDAKRFPQIRYQANGIGKSDDGYRLTGTLEIHGVSNEYAANLRVDDLGEK